MAGCDVIGNIAILKFPDKTGNREKKKTAEKLMRKQKNITTVLEKSEKVKGRLRTIKTKYLAGKKTRETIHHESGCKFKLDVEKCYFSPRLSGERLEAASRITKKDKVLVLFAGVAPFSIVIAKKSGAEVTSVELGRECSRYALENIGLNKIENVKIIRGDVAKLDKLIKKEKFSKIIMPRPQLKEPFLKYVWKFTKRGTEIFYYDFGKDINLILKKVEKEAKLGKKKIKILKLRKAGDIAPHKYRWLVRFRVN